MKLKLLRSLTQLVLLVDEGRGVRQEDVPRPFQNILRVDSVVRLQVFWLVVESDTVLVDFLDSSRSVGNCPSECQIVLEVLFSDKIGADDCRADRVLLLPWLVAIDLAKGRTREVGLRDWVTVDSFGVLRLAEVDGARDLRTVNYIDVQVVDVDI